MPLDSARFGLRPSLISALAGWKQASIPRQARFSPVADELQSILIYAVSEGYAKHIDVADIEGFERELYRFFETEKAPLLLQVKKARKLDDALKREIDAALAEFVERF